MEHCTHGNGRGRGYDWNLAQDVEDLVQSIKDEIATDELVRMGTVSDVQGGESVPRTGLQRFRIASEDVEMKDVDAESGVWSEGDDLVRAQHEVEDTRVVESDSAATIQPQQAAKDPPHTSWEATAKSKRNRRRGVIERAELGAKEAAVERAQQLQLISDTVILGHNAVARDAVSGSLGVIQSKPQIPPAAHKPQLIQEDEVMDITEG